MPAPPRLATFPGEVDHDGLRSMIAGHDDADLSRSSLAIEGTSSLRPITEVVEARPDIEPGQSRAVRAHDDRFDASETPLSYVSLGERLAKANQALADFGPEFVGRVRAAKSRTRGCEACQSSIAKDFIRATVGPDGLPDVPCPVCGVADFCLPDGDVQRKAALVARRDELATAFADARRKLAARRASVVWVVLYAAPVGAVAA